MNKSKLILMLALILLVSGLAGCLGGSSGPVEVTYEEREGPTDTYEDYLGDPQNGNDASSITYPIEFSTPSLISATFTVTWADDAPGSNPDEITITVEGEMGNGVRTLSDSSTTGTVSVTITLPGGDEKLGTAFDVTVSIANCGDTPGGILGLLPFLATPDTGNDFTLEVDYIHEIAIGNSMAPTFTIKDLDGRELSLEKFRGKVVFLDMMATWCETCEKILPELKSLHNKYGDQLVMISIDVSPKDTPEQLRAYAEEHGLHWYHAFDTDGISDKYNIKFIPRLIVIDPNGFVAFDKEGEVTVGEISKSVDASLAGTNAILGIEQQSIYVGAFLAGMLAFFAPCAVPLLPGYMGFYICQEDEEEECETGEDGEPVIPPKRASFLKKGIMGGSAAAAGILTLYVIIGVLAGLAGEVIQPLIPYFGPVIGVLLIIFGIVMVKDITLPTYKITAPFRPVTEKAGKALGKATGGRIKTDSTSAALYKYGLGYGAASAGCVAPVFLMIVFGALATGGFIAGLSVLIIYGMAMALLMIVFTVLVSLAKEVLIRKMLEYMKYMKVVGGAFMVIAGIALLLWTFVA